MTGWGALLGLAIAMVLLSVVLGLSSIDARDLPRWQLPTAAGCLLIGCLLIGLCAEGLHQ